MIAKSVWTELISVFFPSIFFLQRKSGSCFVPSVQFLGPAVMEKKFHSTKKPTGIPKQELLS